MPKAKPHTAVQARKAALAASAPDERERRASAERAPRYDARVAEFDRRKQGKYY